MSILLEASDALSKSTITVDIEAIIRLLKKEDQSFTLAPPVVQHEIEVEKQYEEGYSIPVTNGPLLEYFLEQEILKSLIAMCMADVSCTIVIDLLTIVSL